MNRIKKGDDVIVIAGKDKGKRGNVLVVLTGGRLVISDVNMVKRHTKPNPNRGIPGGIVEKETVRQLEGDLFGVDRLEGLSGARGDPGEARGRSRRFRGASRPAGSSSGVRDLLRRKSGRPGHLG